MTRIALAACVCTSLLFAGCSSSSNRIGKISHIVVIVQENRSVDNLFNGFPGADTAASGTDSNGKTIALTAESLEGAPDKKHSHETWWKEWNQGKMNGFPTSTMTYVPKSETVPYWKLAQKFTFGDRMFQSNTGP